MTKLFFALLPAAALAAPQGTRTLAAAAPPATYTANPAIGPGGSTFKDSAHFRVYGSDGSDADEALSYLEAAHECFITTLNYRSSGLSYNTPESDETGPWTKTNVYSVSVLEGAAGVMHSDAETGMAWLEVQQDYLAVPGVTVHEFGHGVHYHQRAWVDQGRTGAWWETFANWFAETVRTSDLCAAAREANGVQTGATEIELAKVIGDSFQTLVDGSVDTGNYYQAWPFLTYLTSNPDDFAGLGKDTLRQMQLQYEEGSNETPFHTLGRVSTDASVGRIVGRYWAHMAYVDIGHPLAQEAFFAQRDGINFANVDANGSEGSYKVKSERQPRYMGANIIPLQASAGTVSVKVEADAAYTGTLAVSAGSGGETRYVDVVDGAAEVEVKDGEEVSLVVANTPEELILYDAFDLPAEVTKGLDYSFTLTGATVAN